VARKKEFKVESSGLKGREEKDNAETLRTQRIRREEKTRTLRTAECGIRLIGSLPSMEEKLP
jgi:hypothetical protein